MIEIGDCVRIVGGQEVFTIVGIGPDGFYKLQLGNDAATWQYVEGSKLELVAKAAKPDTGPGLVPDRSIME